ncbi:MAG: hypothetical protein ACLUI3_02890 [Christensenellales bacterium]
MAYLMGIDRGSTNVKAAIYDLRGREICAASTPAEIPASRTRAGQSRTCAAFGTIPSGLFAPYYKERS